MPRVFWAPITAKRIQSDPAEITFRRYFFDIVLHTLHRCLRIWIWNFLDRILVISPDLNFEIFLQTGFGLVVLSKYQ